MMSRLAGVGRVLRLAPLVAAAALGVCSTTHLGGTGDVEITTASVNGPQEPAKPLDEVKDDVTLGKEHYRAQNYGLAEMHFRRAVETASGDAEAWLGLAAAYDQLKRFELADRAYARLLKLTGPTPEL